MQQFSVAMCVYGGDNATHFDEALNSVFTQSRKPDEVVLVVDGPISNALEEIIKRYSNKFEYLEVYRLEKNMGHGIARRESITHCTNELVAIADADDINTNDRFEVQLKHFENNPELSAVSSACYHFVGTIDNILNEEKLPCSNDEIVKFMRTRCPLCQASTMFKKSEVLKAGGYQDWYNAEDYYLWVRMHINGAVFENVSKSLLYVRSDEEQMKRRGGYKYFKSMKNLYRFMLKNRLINGREYVFNVCSRFVVQVLMPANLRGVIRKKLM